MAQYEALPGYGKILPPLPSYIAHEPPTTRAAIIYAPGSTVTVPAYLAAPPTAPISPVLQFFEGGNYSDLSMQSVSGDEFIGGSTPSYPEPRFNDHGKSGGIQQTNDSYSYVGGVSTVAAAASQGAKSISLASSLPADYQYVTFSDGFTDEINQVDKSATPISITLDTPLPNAESQGSTVWISTHPPIAVVGSAAAQGARSVSLTINATTWPTPIVPFGSYVIGADVYQIQSVSGSESAGYTVGLATGGLDTDVAAATPVFYNDQAGDVTVSYLDISHDLHSGSGIITTGAGWTVTHNNLHDSYTGDNTGLGNGIFGGDESTIEYNCLSRLGNNAMAGWFGTNAKWDYNEVYQSSYSNDPNCGCTSAAKWWGSFNTDIMDNAFIDGGMGGSGAIWLDNGNAGTNISGNYFYKTYSQAISDETGFNLNVTDNLFKDGGWGNGKGCGDSNCVGAVNLNQSGGFHIPNSRYDNEVNISGNQFVDNWGGVDIWESGLRNCESSGEGYPIDAPYCSGGFPASQAAAATVAGGQYDFSHTTDSSRGDMPTLAQSGSVGSTSILVQGGVGEEDQSAEAINDQIGFSDPASTTVTGGALSVDVTRCTSPNNMCTIPVTSTSGFPASGGELRVGTTAAGHDGGGGFTGAILEYARLGSATVNGTSSPAFVGVTFTRGAGDLESGYSVQQVQPYRVMGETCYANDCKVSISPALMRNVGAGTRIANTGTCSLFATGAATPTAPIAPDGTSYFDGCQWGVRNISVRSNTFVFDPVAIARGTTVTGKSGTTCTAGHADSCGTNFMAFQSAGQKPWNDSTSQNAMMSQSVLTGCPSWDSGCKTNPLANLNALSSPPNAPANNGEKAWNDVWSNNTYKGPWLWNVYGYGTCNLPRDPSTGKSMPAGACTVDFAGWRSDWEQDVNSAYSATVPSSRPAATPK